MSTQHISATAVALAMALTAIPAAFAAQELSLADAQRRAVERSRALSAYDSAIASSREMAVAAGALPDPVLRVGVDNLPIDGGDRFSVARDFMTMRRIGLTQEFTRSQKRELRSERYERDAA